MGLNPLSWFSSSSDVEERVENLEEDMDSLTKVVIENRGDISELDEEKADQKQIGKLEDLIYEELMDKVKEIEEEMEDLSVKNTEEEGKSDLGSQKQEVKEVRKEGSEGSETSRKEVKETNSGSQTLVQEEKEKLREVFDNLTKSERKILEYLLYGDWNKRGDLAREIGISEKTVSNYFSSLKKKGVKIKDKRTGSKEKAYTVEENDLVEEEE